MENDLEKYIFDPANPQKCKVYKLLLNIVKEKDNVAFISPYFFFHIFEKQFDFTFIKNELWDVPENFDDIELVEKLKLYVKQYSATEFYEKVKNWNIEENVTGKIFQHLCNIIYYENPYHKNYKIIFDIDFYHCINYLDDSDRNLFDDNYTYTINRNFVGFIGYEKHNLLVFLDFEFSSVIITTLHEYINNEEAFIKKNVHPLLLKDIKDIHLLLDVLYRDMQKEENLSVQSGIDDIPYLKSISIKNYFCIEDIELDDLQDKKEIYIVGENGDGKTLFLQALTLALKGNDESGTVIDVIKSEKYRMILKASDSSDNEYLFNPKEKQNNGYLNIAAYGVSRNQNDSDKKDEFGYLTLFSSSQYLNNPVKWLQLLHYMQLNGEDDQISLEVAKKMLRDILDENVEIEVMPKKVTFIERGTPISFEQLSDGYKTVVTWICDMIERFSRNQPYVSQLRDLKGIVLVDEIDLHLHPKWKYQIVRKLRRWFPKIQFIVTTHSDTVILGSSEDAVFYKVYKENGIVKISKPLNSIKNQMANTILTSPLFDLEQARAFNNDDNVDTSDDFLYSIIHREIAKRIKQHKGISEDQILDMVIEELNNFEAGHDKNQ